MSVFVTGASGFVGSHLARALVDKGEKVISLVHDSIEWNKWIYQSLKPTIIVTGDIRDIHLLKRTICHYEVDTVYHLAAQSIVKHAWKDPVNTFDVNVMGTIKLLEACRQLDINKILIQSTDKIYGNRMEATVSSRMIPTEPYGSSKICMDIAAQTFAQTYGMKVSVIRCCNIYGYDWNNRIIPNTIRTCLKGENPIIFKNDISQRQYIHVDDAVRALRFLSTRKTGIFNIASETILCQEEVVLKILNFFPSLKPRYIDKPFLHEIKSQSIRANIQGWKPQISFIEGVKRTIDDFRKYLG